MTKKTVETCEAPRPGTVAGNSGRTAARSAIVVAGGVVLAGSMVLMALLVEALAAGGEAAKWVVVASVPIAAASLIISASPDGCGDKVGPLERAPRSKRQWCGLGLGILGFGLALAPSLPMLGW